MPGKEVYRFLFYRRVIALMFFFVLSVGTLHSRTTEPDDDAKPPGKYDPGRSATRR